MASLRWNSGVNNYMTYVAGDVPVGAYDSARLANMGIGHGAFEAACRRTPKPRRDAGLLRQEFPRLRFRRSCAGSYVVLRLQS
jgi:hypothetical protein